MGIIQDRRQPSTAVAGAVADQITTMLAHLRRLTNRTMYAQATMNMEDSAVRTLDRLLEMVSREDTQQVDSQQVPEETPP
eukprot:9089089-Heterocapsa_arctica.AAC.1